MTSSTPLPEQGGFNERLDRILKSIIESYAPYYKEQGLNIEYSVFQKHKVAIRTLIAEEIIGEDSYPHVVPLSAQWQQAAGANALRAEQRKKLGDE